jgi:hypothetical protein
MFKTIKEMSRLHTPVLQAQPSCEARMLMYCPLNGRTADADRGSLSKGGEEKSPYCPKFIIIGSNILDVAHTIALLQLGNLGEELLPSIFLRPQCLHFLAGFEQNIQPAFRLHVPVFEYHDMICATQERAAV